MTQIERPRTRLAAYALCTDDAGRILLCRIARGYPSAGYWTLPGGGVSFGEDPADTVRRELTEETGLTGLPTGLAFVHSGGGVNHGDGDDQPWHAVRIVYHVAVTGGELRDEVDESTDRAAWWRIEEVEQLPIVDLIRVALEYLHVMEARLSSD